MVRCAAAKKKGATTQCTANAMAGHTFCGTHARAKNADLWKDMNDRDVRVVVCQSLARGWLIRRHLQLAGPGVLRRNDLGNDEDIVTCIEASKQHPLDYFAFEENGKVWWFDFGSIWVWSLKSLEPTNPYTRTPLTTEVRKRLREMWALRSNRKLVMPAEPVDPDERMHRRWTVLYQIFADNGFTDVSFTQLSQLGKLSHIAMWRFLREDCPASIALCRYMLSAQLLNSNQATYIMNSLRMLTRVAMSKKEHYATIFNIMSAIYRC